MDDSTSKGATGRRSTSELAEGLAEGLASVVGSALGVGVRVEGLTRLSGGASRETWSFVVVPADGAPERRLVLQRERAGNAATSQAMAVQAELLAAAVAAGVPVPTVVVADPDGVSLGAPAVVMDHDDGETIARRILRDDEYAAARDVLVAQAGAALAAVHRMDDAAVAATEAEDPVAQMRNLLDAFGEPHPAFELGLRWLERNRPAPRPATVVHGDFRMGNLIVGPDGIRAVLDWELAHRGDPIEDLGWFCVRAWRFGSPAVAGGVGSVQQLIDAYVAAGGAPVTVDEVRWWEALGTLRWGLICILQASVHLGGASRSVELAAIGRRTAENEEDLLEIVAGPSDRVPAPAARPSVEVGVAPHDRPTAAELLDAVEEYLTEVRDGVPGRLGFHARVAANVVATVRREIELGPDQARLLDERLASLGISATGRAGEAELAAAIRRGDLDDRVDEVTDAVRATVRDKLAVSNPGYWERPL